MGYDHAKFAQEELAKRNYAAVVKIVLVYYDKYYLKGLQNRENSRILEYNTPIVDPEQTADFLINLTNEIK